MTRNNLKEHLSWLLKEKATVPLDTRHQALGPATTSLDSISSTAIDFGGPRVHLGSTQRLGEESSIQSPTPARTESRPGEMVRVRPCPGSPNKFLNLADSKSIKQSPSKQLRSIPPLQGAGVPRHDPKTASGPPSVVAASPRPKGTPDDIEIMDLTDGMSWMGTPKAERYTVAPISGRKRKSGELEEDTKLSPRQTGQIGQQNRHISDEFPTIDDFVKDSPPRETVVKFSDPPPPYSTMPFKIPASQHSDYKRSPERRMEGGIASPVSVTIDDSDDEDQIPISARAISRSLFSKPATPDVKKSGLFRQKPLALDEAIRTPTLGNSILTSRMSNDQRDSKISVVAESPGCLGSVSAPQSSSSVPSEELSKLKAVFAAPSTRIEHTIQNLDDQMEQICNDIVERMDEGLDETPEMRANLDDLEQRKSLLKELFSKRDAFQEISREKDARIADLKLAVRTRQGLDAARAANTSAKARLQEIESKCLELYQKCQIDLDSIIPDAMGAMEVTSIQPAVESTQAVHAGPSELQVVPSSSRIAQTQPPMAMAPPQRLMPEQSRPQPPRPATRPIGPAHQDPVFFDDDFPDDDMLNANEGLFSNRMGTPPGIFDEEDDDFGMGDDDEMWEAAQNVADAGHGKSRAPSAPAREVLAERSGNRRTEQPSASKTKKHLDQTSAEVERLNFSFPWSLDVKRALKERFKLKGFRQSQVEAINATLAGKDVFVLMPTGGGKSLCYQLPALVCSGKTRGVTIVVSPLVSLMEDQVAHLQALSIQAFLINGETSADQRRFIMQTFSDRNVEKFIQLLYVTPEMLGKSQKMLDAFSVLHRNGRMARIVIDEAHCVSQWGHDFRPDYKALGTVRQKFPGVPVMALTATATENVRIDTIHNLGMKGCEVFSRSFNRPNLYYEVRPKGKSADDIDEIASLIKGQYRRQTGIIYCLSRANCEKYARDLQAKGVKAHHYHAGLAAAVKSEVQRDWQAGVHQVIVATIAFGMGIDKANVRFVIHMTLPKSLEGYYQETGRAGRDGQGSGCYLFYHYKDTIQLRRMIDSNEEASFEQKERQRQMLQRMMQYCDNKVDCRRVQVLSYFNEKFDPEDCNGQCDNCKSDVRFERVDFTEAARNAVKLVGDITGNQVPRANDVHDRFANQLLDRVTLGQVMDIFRGSNNKKMRDSWTDYEGYGAGADLPRAHVERLFHTLISEDVLREVHVLNKANFPMQYVSLGRSYNRYSGSTQFHLQVATAAGSKATKATGKTAGKKNAKKSVASMMQDMPLSTNVSSPVQAGSKRKKAARVIASDDETDSDDAFAPVRGPGNAQRSKVRELGPPIRSDKVMDGLNDILKQVVESFVHAAEEKCKEIMKKKNLRFQPFTNTMLRDMAINFTDTEEKMLAIRGIDPDKVRALGKPFMKMAAEYRDNYHAMMSAPDDEFDDDEFDDHPFDDQPFADKHAQNVIDLVSDDDEDEEYENEGGAECSSSIDADDDEGTQSAYFQPPPEVAAWNARYSQGQPAGMRTIGAASSPPTTTFTKKKRSTTKWTAKSHGGARSKVRKASGSFEGYRYAEAGPSQKRAPAKKVSRAAAAKRGAMVKRALSSVAAMPT